MQPKFVERSNISVNMADFMDGEAVETSEEEMSDDDSRAKVKSPSSKKRQSKVISSDEEEEEDDEERAKEEMKGFIAVSFDKMSYVLYHYLIHMLIAELSLLGISFISITVLY